MAGLEFVQHENAPVPGEHERPDDAVLVRGHEHDRRAVRGVRGVEEPFALEVVDDLVARVLLGLVVLPVAELRAHVEPVERVVRMDELLEVEHPPVSGHLHVSRRRVGRPPLRRAVRGSRRSVPGSGLSVPGPGFSVPGPGLSVRVRRTSARGTVVPVRGRVSSRRFWSRAVLRGGRRTGRRGLSALLVRPALRLLGLPPLLLGPEVRHGRVAVEHDLVEERVLRRPRAAGLRGGLLRRAEQAVREGGELHERAALVLLRERAVHSPDVERAERLRAGLLVEPLPDSLRRVAEALAQVLQVLLAPQPGRLREVRERVEGLVERGGVVDDGLEARLEPVAPLGAGRLRGDGDPPDDARGLGGRDARARIARDRELDRMLRGDEVALASEAALVPDPRALLRRGVHPGLGRDGVPGRLGDRLGCGRVGPGEVGRARRRLRELDQARRSVLCRERDEVAPGRVPPFVRPRPDPLETPPESRRHRRARVHLPPCLRVVEGPHAVQRGLRVCRRALAVEEQREPVRGLLREALLLEGARARIGDRPPVLRSHAHALRRIGPDSPQEVELLHRAADAQEVARHRAGACVARRVGPVDHAAFDQRTDLEPDVPLVAGPAQPRLRPGLRESEPREVPLRRRGFGPAGDVVLGELPEPLRALVRHVVRRRLVRLADRPPGLAQLREEVRRVARLLRGEAALPLERIRPAFDPDLREPPKFLVRLEEIATILGRDHLLERRELVHRLLEVRAPRLPPGRAALRRERIREPAALRVADDDAARLDDEHGPERSDEILREPLRERAHGVLVERERVVDLHDSVLEALLDGLRHRTDHRMAENFPVPDATPEPLQEREAHFLVGHVAQKSLHLQPLRVGVEPREHGGADDVVRVRDVAAVHGHVVVHLVHRLERDERGPRVRDRRGGHVRKRRDGADHRVPDESVFLADGLELHLGHVILVSARGEVACRLVEVLAALRDLVHVDARVDHERLVRLAERCRHDAERHVRGPDGRVLDGVRESALHLGLQDGPRPHDRALHLVGEPHELGDVRLGKTVVGTLHDGPDAVVGVRLALLREGSERERDLVPGVLARELGLVVALDLRLVPFAFGGPVRVAPSELPDGVGRGDELGVRLAPDPVPGRVDERLVRAPHVLRHVHLHLGPGERCRDRVVWTVLREVGDSLPDAPPERVERLPVLERLRASASLVLRVVVAVALREPAVLSREGEPPHVLERLAAPPGAVPLPVRRPHPKIRVLGSGEKVRVPEGLRAHLEVRRPRVDLTRGARAHLEELARDVVRARAPRLVRLADRVRVQGDLHPPGRRDLRGPRVDGLSFGVRLVVHRGLRVLFRQSCPSSVFSASIGRLVLILSRRTKSAFRPCSRTRFS